MGRGTTMALRGLCVSSGGRLSGVKNMGAPVKEERLSGQFNTPNIPNGSENKPFREVQDV